MSIEFKPDNAHGGVLAYWLRDLGSDHGVRAEIRRCRSADEVGFQPAFVRLCASRLRPLMAQEKGWMDRMAAIYGLAAHLKPEQHGVVLNAKQSLALQMADSRGGRPAIAELRFRRLLQYDRQDLYRPLLRIVRALDGAANAYDLANSVYYWGDSVRKRWALDYFPNVKP